MRQVLTKPKSLVAIGLGLVIIAVVFYLQEDPAALTLETPEVRYELLQNQGATSGIPIAIRLGPLTVFQISDPAAGGGGATRAREVVANLEVAVAQLVATPGLVITIENSREEGMLTIVQKEKVDSPESLEIVSVTPDDLRLVDSEDAKLLARVWAERLTDSLRLLIFGSPPEFSRDTAFGSALDTLYVDTRNVHGRLTSDGLTEVFEGLRDDVREALVGFPPLPQSDSEVGQGS